MLKDLASEASEHMNFVTDALQISSHDLCKMLAVVEALDYQTKTMSGHAESVKAGASKRSRLMTSFSDDEIASIRGEEEVAAETQDLDEDYEDNGSGSNDNSESS